MTSDSLLNVDAAKGVPLKEIYPSLDWSVFYIECDTVECDTFTRCPLADFGLLVTKT